LGKTEKIEEFEFYHLDNGITVIHKSVTNSKVAHCGFILNVGTRDEAPHEQGIAHFWEHMAFKGTSKRKAYHLINRLEVVGGAATRGRCSCGAKTKKQSEKSG
jgi:predicted Zn-dependent peptidase